MAGEIKGITIEIGGDTSKLNRALNEMGKSLKTTQNELKHVEKSLKLDPSNVTLLTQKQKLLTKAIDDTAKNLDALKKAKEQADNDAGVDKNSEQYRRLEREISDTEAKMKRFNDQLKTTTNELKAQKSGLADLAKGFNGFGDNLTNLGNSLKGISATAGALVGALSAVTLSAGKNADEINTLAKTYDLTTDQIQAFQLASDLIDVDLNTITGAYSKLTKAMTSKSAGEEFRKLGVSLKGSNGELRSVNDVFNDTIKALGNIENETQRDAEAMAIFGKSAVSLNPLINGGAEQLATFTEYLEENSLILSGDELDALNDMDDALNTLKATLKAVGGIIAGVFAEPLQQAFTAIGEVVLKFREKLAEVNPQFIRIGALVAGVVSALAPMLLTFGKLSKTIGGLLTKFAGAGGLSGALGSLLNPIGLAVAGFGVLMATNEDFRNGIIKLVQTIGGALKPLLDTATATLKSLWGVISANLMPTIQHFGDILATRILPVIQSVAEWAGAHLVPILQTMAVWFGDKLAGALNTAFDAVNWLLDKFEALLDFFKNIINWVKQLIEWFGALGDKISSLAGSIGSFISDKLGAVSSFFGGGASYGAGFSSGGFASGGLVVNSTINVNNNGAPIDSRSVKMWSKMLVDDINEQLGGMLLNA